MGAFFLLWALDERIFYSTIQPALAQYENFILERQFRCRQQVLKKELKKKERINSQIFENVCILINQKRKEKKRKRLYFKQ